MKLNLTTLYKRVLDNSIYLSEVQELLSYFLSKDKQMFRESPRGLSPRETENINLVPDVSDSPSKIEHYLLLYCMDRAVKEDIITPGELADLNEKSTLLTDVYEGVRKYGFLSRGRS